MKIFPPTAILVVFSNSYLLFLSGQEKPYYFDKEKHSCAVSNLIDYIESAKPYCIDVVVRDFIEDFHISKFPKEKSFPMLFFDKKEVSHAIASARWKDKYHHYSKFLHRNKSSLISSYIHNSSEYSDLFSSLVHSDRSIRHICSLGKLYESNFLDNGFLNIIVRVDIDSDNCMVYSYFGNHHILSRVLRLGQEQALSESSLCDTIDHSIEYMQRNIDSPNNRKVTLYLPDHIVSDESILNRFSNYVISEEGELSSIKQQESMWRSSDRPVVPAQYQFSVNSRFQKKNNLSVVSYFLTSFATILLVLSCYFYYFNYKTLLLQNHISYLHAHSTVDDKNIQLITNEREYLDEVSNFSLELSRASNSPFKMLHFLSAWLEQYPQYNLESVSWDFGHPADHSSFASSNYLQHEVSEVKPIDVKNRELLLSAILTTNNIDLLQRSGNSTEYTHSDSEDNDHVEYRTKIIDNSRLQLSLSFSKQAKHN